MKPILSIISALLVTVIPFFVLFDIGLLYHIHIMSLIFLFIIFMIIGGGISTWFSNENKIRYSVVLWINKSTIIWNNSTIIFRQFLLYISLGTNFCRICRYYC